MSHSQQPSRVPEEPHGVTVPTPHHHVNYFAIFGTLVVLTIVTVAVAFLDIHNEAIKVALALTIASIKAACVGLFFMHLKFEGKLIYTIVIVPLSLCVLLVVAIIPDILMVHPPDSSSLWLFNGFERLFKMALGAKWTPVPAVIVDLEKLTHRYGLRIALHELTLQISAGEIFSLLGPNGSGKTTLFRILSTLIKPQDGRAAVFGHDLVTQSNQVRREIGVVFQSPSLDKQLTARENLKYHGSLFGLDRSEIRKRSEELLQRVGLADRADERVSTFSGGMRRRVEIAKGLLNRPKLLLLDEPSTGLDPAARLEIWKYLDEVRTADGVTVVMTTHLMDEADRCDRVAILDSGRLVACDTPTALKEKIGGDVITIASSDPSAVAVVLREKFQIEPQLIGNIVRFERARGHEILPDLIEALRGLITEISLGKPTLEDVFIRVTGREFDVEM